MGLDIKKILSLAGGIAATVATGGVAAPVLIPQVLNIASELIPQKDAEKIAKKAELDNWERIMIVEWVETYKRFMTRPMSTKTRKRTFEGKLRSDFIMNYADMPKDKWVQGINEMVAEAVRWQIASSG